MGFWGVGKQKKKVLKDPPAKENDCQVERGYKGGVKNGEHGERHETPHKKKQFFQGKPRPRLVGEENYPSPKNTRMQKKKDHGVLGDGLE